MRGPLIVVELSATAYVAPEFTLRVDDFGNLHLEMQRAMKLDAVTLAVMNNRLAAIAEEMGVVLGQTGFSPNIKERHDFSCALFDGARRAGRAGRAHPGSSRLDAAFGARRDRTARARPAATSPRSTIRSPAEPICRT